MTRIDRKMHSNIKRFATALALGIAIHGAYAGSATWNLNAVNNHWSKAGNWTPATVPYGENDVASFGTSNVTDVMLGATQNGDAGNTLGGIVFEPGGSAYTITMTAVYGQTSYLAFYGAGITNNSGTTQNVIAAKSAISDSAQTYFLNSASAGENVVITNEGAVHGGVAGGSTRFWDNSNAATATVISEGSTASGTISGGFTVLLDYSSAENATFINNPGTVSGAAAAYTLIQTFLPGGNLGTSTFIANPATVPGAEGGWVEMDVGTCAGTRFIANGASVADCQAGQVYAYGAENGTRQGVATYTANGGNGSNAQGGLIDVFHLPLSDQTVVIANPGSNGGLGGTILLEDTDDLPVPQFQVFGNGALDLTNVTEPTIAVGSLAGDGLVPLAGHSLDVGSNNLSTSFSGVIQESGSMVKSGTGTFTLSGANTYTGGTTVSAGTLIVRNRSGSATGTGPVKVNAGTLGGQGTIQGGVTVGAGSGTGAFLTPSSGSNQPATLTLKKTLTLKADSTYTCKLNSNKGRADQVMARGVTIESGAQFDFQPVANKRLMIGTVFTVINNTSANPMTGAFVNLADNSTFASGRNNYQVSYEGGTGNDLTLTVVP